MIKITQNFRFNQELVVFNHFLKTIIYKHFYNIKLKNSPQKMFTWSRKNKIDFHD